MVNAGEAAAGFAISGSETGANGQPVTVTISDSQGHVVDSYTTTASGGSWSVSVTSAQAQALQDGTYTVTASVSDGNETTATATQALTVAELGITITTIAGDNVVNAGEAAAGFAISGSETGANGQPVTVTISDSQGHVVDSYTTTASGGSWSVSVTSAQAQALQDGTYTVTASVSDGNETTATATQALTVAELGITITTIAGDNVVNAGEAAAGFAISGSETGANGQPVTVTISDSQGHVVDSYTTTASGGSWSVSVTSAQAQALQDGTYTVTASVSDGNETTATATQALTVAELGITITTIAGDNVVNAGEAAAGFAISGSETGANGQPVTVTISDSQGHVVDSYTTTASGGSWSVSVTSAQAQALQDGTYTVTASVSDGNETTATATQALTVAELGITITTIAGDNVVNAGEAAAGFAISGSETGANGQPVTVTISDSQGHVVDSYTTTASGGSWSVSVTSAQAQALQDGTYTVTASVSDGNETTATATQALTVAELGITITTIAGDNVVNAGEAAAGFAISGSETGANGQPVTVTISDSQGHVVDSYTTTASGGSWSVSVTSAQAQALQDGTYTVTASVSDGNETTATATQALTVAELGITITTIAGDNVVNAGEAAAGFAISGSETGANGQPVTVTISDSQGHVVDSYTTTASGGSWSVSVTSAQAQALQDGTYTVTASVSDGNETTATATQALTVAELGITITTIAGDNVVNAGEAAAGFAISGSETGANGQPVTVTISDSQGHVVDSYTTTASGGSWSVSVTSAQAQALRDGTYTVTAQVTTGNASVSESVQVVVAETLPTVTIDPVDGNNVINHAEAAAGVTLSGTVTGLAAGATFTVTVTDGTFSKNYTATVNTAGTGWTAPIPASDALALPNGTATATAQVTDQNGNASVSKSVQFVVDTEQNEQVTINLTGLTNGYGLEDHTIAANIADDDTPSASVTYTWEISHDGGKTWSVVGSNNNSYAPTESDEGALLKVLVSFTNSAGNMETGSSTTIGVLPLVTIANNALSVSPQGSVGLGISIQPEPFSDDTIQVTISFASGSHAPTITAGDGETGTPVTINGITEYTFTQTAVNSGLTFHNQGDQSDTLTVSELVDGAVATTQTIIVTDPPITTASNLNAAVGNGSDTITINTMLELAGATAAAITFANSNGDSGILVLDNSTAFTGKINGFAGDGTLAHSDQVDLKDINYFSASETYTENSTGNGGTLTVSDGTHTAHIYFNGDYVLANFILASDGGGGTLVIDPPAAGAVGVASETNPEQSSGIPALVQASPVAFVNILQLDGPDGGDIGFSGAAGELIFDDPIHFTGTITGFTGSDEIDLTNINWNSAEVISGYSYSTNITSLTITDAQGNKDTLSLAGNYTGSKWIVFSDGSGGTILVDQPAPGDATVGSSSVAENNSTSNDSQPVDDQPAVNTGTLDKSMQLYINALLSEHDHFVIAHEVNHPGSAPALGTSMLPQVNPEVNQLVLQQSDSFSFQHIELLGLATDTLKGDPSVHILDPLFGSNSPHAQKLEEIFAQINDHQLPAQPGPATADTHQADVSTVFTYFYGQVHLHSHLM